MEWSDSLFSESGLQFGRPLPFKHNDTRVVLRAKQGTHRPPHSRRGGPPRRSLSHHQAAAACLLGAPHCRLAARDRDEGAILFSLEWRNGCRSFLHRGGHVDGTIVLADSTPRHKRCLQNKSTRQQLSEGCTQRSKNDRQLSMVSQRS